MKKCMSGCGGKMMSKGGKVSPVKKMKKGGITQDIVGMPGYNATLYPTSFKKGGAASTTNRAVSPSCKGGQVKDASGKCVNERQFKNGGAIKKMQPGGATGPNPNPTGKRKFEDLLGAAAGIAGIVGASSYFNSDKAAARQKARLDKKEVRKEARQDARQDRQTARAVAKSNKKEKEGFKATSSASFKNGGATSFGMLSVKAGIDKNPKPTDADRIAGAKMKKKMGGSTKKK